MLFCFLNINRHELTPNYVCHYKGDFILSSSQKQPFLFQLADCERTWGKVIKNLKIKMATKTLKFFEHSCEI